MFFTYSCLFNLQLLIENLKNELQKFSGRIVNSIKSSFLQLNSKKTNGFSFDNFEKAFDSRFLSVQLRQYNFTSTLRSMNVNECERELFGTVARKGVLCLNNW